MSPESSSPRNNFTTFAVGALIGAGIALLYAPYSGKEMRKLLAQKAKVLRNKAQISVENTQQFIKNETADFAAAFDSGKETTGYKPS